ncbi:MAG: short-chain dehydrogenase [Actinomycetia bacterium]|jgi:NAD(P)-dependent dehydrogenase (short-subunit alcohol dehydrogenase family)|nr:short-chain dehydrogenase [Actinomycetes bacterium]
MEDLRGKVAVVTGGAGGIGKGIVKALLAEGATVVVADVEKVALDAAVVELSPLGAVSGIQVDVSDADSVESLAEQVYAAHGACHLLFNNAGVTSGGGGRPWEQEINDWKWCLGVNVFGVANGVLAFVPRMVAGGQEGHVINTSSGDGGFAPVPHASVYATSKAAVSCFTEALAHQFAQGGTNLKASVFYPSGGLLDTGLFTATRNRPADLQRVKDHPPSPQATFEAFKQSVEDSTGAPAVLQDLDELGRFVVDQLKAGKFIIGKKLDEVGVMLHARADAIARGELPPALHI